MESTTISYITCGHFYPSFYALWRCLKVYGLADLMKDIVTMGSASCHSAICVFDAEENHTVYANSSLAYHQLVLHGNLTRVF